MTFVSHGFSRSHFSRMFCSIGGFVFTHPVGDSRPPSAVNDPTVITQVNSENHTSNKWLNHFSIRIP